MFRSIFHKLVIGLMAFGLGATLSACGSGGGGGGGAVNNPPAATITGTAATGAPFANQTITLISSNGTSRTVATGLDGTFSADVTGLSGPYLLYTGSGNQTLLSWSPGSGVANITPLTTLALELAVVSDVLDMTIDWATQNSLITQDGINSMLAVINANLKDQFTAAGLTPQTYNFLRTPFIANSQGIDTVLDGIHIDFNFDTGSFSLKDPSDNPIPFNPNIDTTGYNGGNNTGPVNVTVSDSGPEATMNGTIEAVLVNVSETTEQGVPIIIVGVGGSIGGSWGVSMNVYYDKTTGAVTKVTFGWSSFTAGGQSYFVSCGLGNNAACSGATVDLSSTPATITLADVALATPTGLGVTPANGTLNGTIKFTPPTAN